MSVGGTKESAKLGPVGQLFTRYGGTVFRRCRALLGNDDLARDAVQEVFLRVVRNANTFRGESSQLTWLYSIATLYCFQYLRNRGRAHHKLSALHGQAEARYEPCLDDWIALADVLEPCDPLVQQIVILRYVDEMTMDEIAEVVGLSRKTITKKLQRFSFDARRRLETERRCASQELVTER